MSNCLMCGQENPVNSEHARMMRARAAVLDAWKIGTYGEQLGVALKSLRWIDMLDDAIRAVRAADAESDRLSAELPAP